MTYKVCTRCKSEKPLGEFSAAQGYSGGINARCRECRRVVTGEWYGEHREIVSQRNQERYYSNLDESRRKGRERALAYLRRKGVKPQRVFASEQERAAAQVEQKRFWVERNPEKRRQSCRDYAARHPEGVRVSRANHKGKRWDADGHLSVKEWKAILLFYGNRCALCDVSAADRPLTIDHFIPLVRGGGTDWTNVWPLCLVCNVKKGTSMPHAEKPPHVEALLKTGTFN